MSIKFPKVLAFLKPAPKVAVQVQILQRDVCRLTMAEWRATPDLCKVAARVLSDQAARNMLDVLRTEHLANYLSTQPMSLEDRAIISARAEGYCIALNNFEALGKFETPKAMLEETFEPPEMVET